MLVFQKGLALKPLSRIPRVDPQRDGDGDGPEGDAPPVAFRLVEQRRDQRHALCQSCKPGIALAQGCGDQQDARRVDQQQYPGAPGHGRGRLEGGVEAEDVDLVLQVEEERGHAGRQHDRRPQRQLPGREGGLAGAPRQVGGGGEDQDARGHAAEEEVEGDLPGPDAQDRVDLGVVAGSGQYLFDHRGRPRRRSVLR
jgi:hypothetical protein